MRSLLFLSSQKSKIGLHLLLVFGVVLYLFSPLLDHWLGFENYTRPHTHIHLSENASTHLHTFGQEAGDHMSGDAGHDDGFLCLLDINALFYVALNISVTESDCAVQNTPLIFDLSPSYLQVSTIYFSSLDPPPRSYT